MSRKNRRKDRTIAYQLKNSVIENFKEGRDKHSIKKNEGYKMDHRVFSYSQAENLIKLSNNFGSYMKRVYPDIKEVKNIKTEHVENFLKYSSEPHATAKLGCSQHTVDNYAHNLNKLAECCNYTYKTCDLNFRDAEIPICEKEFDSRWGVNNSIPREDIEKVNNYLREKENKDEREQQQAYAIELLSKYGVRSHEVVRLNESQIDLDKGVINFIGKGGRHYDPKELSEEEKELFKEIIEKNFSPENDRIFNITEKDVNNKLTDALEDLGLEHHSPHDIRRLCTEEVYAEARDNGLSKEEAVEIACNFLGHGKEREWEEKLLSGSYIEIW